MSVECKVLEKYLNQRLAIDSFSDYGPNGLQIQGQECISKIAFAVSATAASVKQTIEAKAQALIVHHGLFWSFHGARPLVGPFGARVLPIVQNQINLFGYHLPLDAHLELGNAASLAKLIALEELRPFGDYKGSATGIQGSFKMPIPAQKLKQKLQQILNHNIMMASPEEDSPIKTLGIITGGANSDWTKAVSAGLDGYLTGEMSEHDWHESQEAGITMFAGGHNATEQFGVQALMKDIQQRFQIECVYFPSLNPA